MKTTNYNQFILLKENRSIVRAKVERFKKSFSQVGYLESLPIICTKKNEVVDGQHRLIACSESNIPVHFAYLKDGLDPLVMMIELNKNQDVWRLSSYIKHFAERGVKFHSAVSAFEDTYKLGISNSIIICGGGKVSSTAIRDGKNIKLFDGRERLVEYLLSFKNLPFYNSSKFVDAITVLFKKVDRSALLKVQRKHMIITQQASVIMYLSLFANIINKGRSQSDQISL